MNLLLCVDPGLANIGSVVVELPHGNLLEMHHHSTERIDRRVPWRHSDDKARRVAECARFYSDIIKRLDIRKCAAELPSGGAPNSQAACDLAYAAACLVSVLSIHEVAVEWYTAREVKKAATGRSGASKPQVMLAIEEIYPQMAHMFPAKDKREHVCDAAAVWLAARDGNLAKL